MLALGAPGIYEQPGEPLRSLTGERLDVCAFVGVAPRGPAREVRFTASWLPRPDEDDPPVRRSVPVVVESFAEYRRRFGGFEGPGRLPYAVAAFFENGGARAVIVRVVHGDEPFRHCARGTLWGLTVTPGAAPVRVWARNEGTWGNQLAVRVTPQTRPLAFDVSHSTTAALRVGRLTDVGPGTTLRLVTGGARALRRVLERRVEQAPDGTFFAELRLDAVLPAAATSAEVVELTVDVWESPAPPPASLATEAWTVRAVAVEDDGSTLTVGAAVSVAGDARTVSAITSATAAGRAVRWLELDAPVQLSEAPASVTVAGVTRALVTVRVGALRVAADAVLPSPLVGAQLLLDGATEVGARRVLTKADVLVDGKVVSRVLGLDAPFDALPARVDVDPRLEPGDGRATERFEHVGLSALHPRWLGRVLLEDSALVQPAPDWLDADLELPASLPAAQTFVFHGGVDGYEELVTQDFFGDWSAGEPVDWAGVHCLVAAPEVALICTPDLYVPEPLPARAADEPLVGTGRFEACLEGEGLQGEPTSGELAGLRLDPVLDLDTIRGLQQRLVDFAEQLRRPVVLLDVPLRLNARQVLTWRSHFDSAFAAAYHPWLRVSRADDSREGLLSLPPSAVAAGVIAARERTLGVPHGPANTVVAGVVDVLERVPPARHDAFHQEGLNVFLLERDGPRLTGARTLSRDPAWRQLSVRRLMTLLALTLERQMQWAVFQPNGRKLRADLRRVIEHFLDSLHRAGAFVGATQKDSYFVRCDETLNTPEVIDRGQLLVEIGVAPAEPMEFLVLTLTRELDGELSLQEKRRG
ncbi:MAG: phage tail sheath C-terminal domain-containing protein [Myxococcota bacterium]